MEFDADEPSAPAIAKRLAGWPGTETFGARYRAALADAVGRVELVLHTGDWCDFPTAANLRLMHAQQRGETPFWWVSGNHDWYFAGEPPEAATKEANLPLLAPLGYAPCWARDFGGVRFIGVDNSRYQVTAAQLAFLRAQLAGGPAVLLLHIPITQPGLRERARQRWGCPILMGEDLTPDQRRGWGVAPDNPATAEFIATCQTSPRLRAVLAGHVHFAHSEPLPNGAGQHVGAPAYEGGWSLLEFVPA